MAKQRRSTGLPSATPTHSYDVKDAPGGVGGSAARFGSGDQQDLGRAETVLEALCSESRRQCDDAMDAMCSMDARTFRTTLLGGTRLKTLHSLEQCIQASIRNSRFQERLLAETSALKLDKQTLADSRLQRQLLALSCSTVTATANLAEEILSRQEAKPSSARYRRDCQLEQLLPY